MPNNTILAYKHIGETPLSVIQRLKDAVTALSTKKISYAGRLDPMAEGLILLLVDEENKNRKAYEALAKTYMVEILLGISTDTYDLLGLVTDTKLPAHQTVKAAKTQLQSFKGKRRMPYPPYSSKPVNGKPLYFWARESLLETITLPEKNIEIYSVKALQTKEIKGKEISTYINEKIQQVTGNFRQNEISNQWNEFEDRHADDCYYILQAEIACSSGTYMRTIAHSLGEIIGIPTLAFSITRTQIGNFTLKDITKLDDHGLIQ